MDVADRFCLMALFAEVVYRRDLDAKFKDDDSKDGKGCRYLKHPPSPGQGRHALLR